LRESQYTINALRDKLIEVGKANSNVKFEDQSRTIEFLRVELAKTSEELSRLRNSVPTQPTSLVTSATQQNASGDVRALQARNQELEAQLRSSKLSYENTIRDLKTQIERLESENRTLQVRVNEKPVGSSSTTFGSPTGQNIGETPRGSTSSYGQFTPSSTSSQNTGTFGSATYNSGRPQGNLTTSGVAGSTNLTSSGSYRPSGTTGTTYGATGATGYGATSSSYSSNSGVTTSQVGGATYGATGLSGSRTSGAVGGATYTSGTTGGASYTAGSSNLSGSGSFRTSGTTGGSIGFTSGTTGLSGSRTGTSGTTGYSSTTYGQGLSGSRTNQRQ
jgi:HPt (histidine-containing phosphotransfer) domain-containing protein